MILQYFCKYLFIYVYIRIVESAPAEKIHGSMGWNITSKIPKSLYDSWLCNLFSGTINGFCKRSLKKNIQRLNIYIDMQKKILIYLTCTPFHETQ